MKDLLEELGLMIAMSILMAIAMFPFILVVYYMDQLFKALGHQ